jgi:2-polyprenyl-3-methyl-5-hydroxy-6-metoxy-1,4-benzoquinol methylase
MDIDWDARYRASPGKTEPSEILTVYAPLLPKRGRALDVACGNGRNSVWLAERGLEVTAVDISAEALRLGRELAQRRGVCIQWIQAAAEDFNLATAAYDLIVCIHFHHPKLYASMQRALRPGGWLVYETYTLAQLRYDFGPRSPEHLLQPGELLAAFGSLRVAYYHEFEEPRGAASLIAQKPGPPIW